MSLPKGYEYTNATIAYVAENGQPGEVDGVPTWECAPPELLDITPTPDGKGARIAHGGVKGEAQVTVTADVDLGSGFSPLVTLIVIDCLGDAAVGATVTLGEPTPIAATPKK